MTARAASLPSRGIAIAALLAAVASLSGCLEEGGTVSYRPGVYQGAADPLLGNIDADALAQRLTAGQSDR